MPDTAPLSGKLTATVPAAGAAVAQDQTIGEAPYDLSVTGVTIIPEANLTGHASNYRTFSVINKGLDGNGSTVVASFATDTPTTDDLADFDEKSLTLSVVADADEVLAGSILAVAETVTGSGVAHSGYLIELEYTRGTD